MQNPAPEPTKSSTGLDANVAAAICYIWIVGLIFFFLEKENRFIRFNAMQSVLYGIMGSIVMIAFVIINIVLAIAIAAVSSTAGDAAGGILSLLVSLISLVIWLVVPLVYFLGLILGAVKAYQGKTFKFPIIGNMAEKIANK
jgi:uncharacterized membrane protein